MIKKFFYKKNVFLTGGNRGLGKKIINRILKTSYIVITNTSNIINTKKFNIYLKTKKILNVITFSINFNNTIKLKNVLKYIEKKIPNPLIIINNAGVKLDNIFLKTREEDWNSVLNVNLTAIYHIIKIFLPKLIKLKWGRIINISSIFANIGNIGQTNYSAAKSGLLGFSKSLAKEIKKNGITINVVAPGFVKSRMTRSIFFKYFKNNVCINKFCNAKNIVFLIKFLISNQAHNVNGEIFNIDNCQRI